MLKRILWLILSLLAGGAAGLILTTLFLRGWFSPWITVEMPSAGAVQLLALDGEKLWIEAEGGEIYLNTATHACREDCWSRVEEVQRDPTPSARGDLPESCLPAPPLMGVESRISECKLGQWYDENTVYALHSNGSISVWRFSSGGEWGFVVLLMAAIVGAGLFFSIALIVILIKAITDWARKQSLP